MKDITNKLATITFILVCISIPAVSGTTLTAKGGTIALVGNSANFSIIADSLPNGLSGFSLTASLSDPSKAEIIEVITPSWAGVPPFGILGSVPADSVDITLVDLYLNADDPVTNFTLITLKIRGDAVGSTGLRIYNVDIQDKDGFPISTVIQNGTIIIGSTPPPVNTGTLYVQSNPTAAVVKLDGLNQGTTPLTIPNISAGDHTLRLEKTGYYPWQDQVTITAGITNPVYVTLTPIPPPPTTGTLVVNSNPNEANVKIDGIYKGLTNLTISNVPAALHTVRVEKTGYYPRQEEVVVAAGLTTYVNWTLTPIPQPPITTGNVSVISTPGGASVFLNGTPKGSTPLSINDVPAGGYTLRLQAAGYYPREEDIIVGAGLTTYVNWTLTPIPQPPITTGNVSVISTPGGASVFLNGTPKGPTPLSINDVPAGGYTLRLQAAGYTPREEDIIVTAGLTTYINWTLIPIPVTNGTVSVQSTPSGASVTLNGTPKGPTPLLINDVTAGGYTLRVAAAGYYPREEDITVTAGLTTYVNWTLLPIPPTTGNVSVKSTPSNASILLNGTPKGETPLMIEDLTAGDYSLYVEAAGYYPREEDIMVTAGLTTYVNWTLVPIPTTGNLDISSVPSVANVFLDGDLQGPTPLFIMNLEPGQYVVRMEKSGFQIWNETFNVTTGDTTIVNAVLVPITTPTPTPIPTTVQEGKGGLLVLSEPIATVFIDGKERGISGQVIDEVQAGTRAVTLFKPGYKLVSFPVKINPARATVTPKIILEPDTGPPIPPTTIPTTIPTTVPTTVPTTLPTLIPTTFPTIIPTYPGPLTGSLFIYSVPWGCSVYIDDTYRGVTPGLYSQLVPGSHVLKVSRGGYVDTVRSFDVIAGDVTTLTIIMVPDISGIVAAFL